MITTIKKRDGRTVAFHSDKIADAVFQAAQAIGGTDRDMAGDIARQVCEYLEQGLGLADPTVEQVQDAVEKVLIDNGHARTAKELYSLPRRAHPGAGDEHPSDEASTRT